MKDKFVASMLAMSAGLAFADVKTTDSAPVIDGKLDEAIWSQADWETGFQRFNTEKKSRMPTAQTEFAILADSEALYIGVKACHPKMDEMKALSPASLWYSENVELYFIPDGGAFEFYQFLVSFEGRTAAKFYSEGGNIQPDPYGPVWECKTAETPEGWAAEVRIPLSAFYMTRNDAWRDSWKVNVGRRYREREHSEFSCWVDGSGYRDFKHYRTVRGFPVRRAEEDVWVKSVVANVKGPEDGRLVGMLDFVINAAKGGAFTLESGFSASEKLTLKSGDNKVAVAATFPENGRHQLPIALTRTDGNGDCRRVYPVIVDYRPIRFAFTLPAYRGNFYPGQNSDCVKGAVTAAVEGAIELTLEGPGFGKRTKTLAASGPFIFDTKGFETGTATLTAKVGGETLVRKIRKLAPLGEGRHVSWIENGNLVVDGKAVLRRNMYATHYMGGEAFKRKFDADDLHITKNIHGCGTLEPGRLIKGLEQKEAIRDVKPCDELFAKVDEVIEKAMNESGTYYYISDEPECRGVSPVYLKYIYDYVCEKDPYHVILTCSRAGETYLECADWFETHPYINAHHDETGKRVYGRNFNELGDFISAFNPESHPDKCIGGTATCFAYSLGDYPTFTEYIANAWCEFLRGAKSLYPYAYHDLGDRAALYEGTRYLFSSAEALEPILLHGVRKTLAKTAEYEAALWTMPDGAQMFCVQNFKDAPQTVSVPGLSGTFTEFRGTRTFNLSTVQPSTFNLQPLESLVATTKKYDAGLLTFAETQAKIDALENERLGRPNQLLGRHSDVEVTTSMKKGGGRKMFDGTRDVIAWYDNYGKDKFYEMSFPKFVPEFSEISVFGFNIEGMRVKARVDGEWKELLPASTEKDVFRLRYVFDRKYSTVKLRLEFPKNKVELYEIEIPGTARQKTAVSAKDLIVRKSTDYWVRTVPNGASSNVWWRVRREPGQKYLSFEFRSVRRRAEGKYTNWGLYLDKSAGYLCGGTTMPETGLYTLRIPDYQGVEMTDVLQIRNHNLVLDIGDIICSREPPENRVEFVEEGGEWTVRLFLSERCEDVSCAILVFGQQGAKGFSADGKSFFDMRPADDTCRVWQGKMPVPQNSMKRNDKGKLSRPFVKVTVLGGGIDRPLVTWLDRAIDSGAGK